jgi:hypothetical protein
MRRRRRIVLVVTAVCAVVGSVSGALAFGSSSPNQSATPALREGLEAQMDQAVAEGPYSITCVPAADGRLACSPMKDRDVIPALKRGEVVYGRTVIAFPGGAKVEKHSSPTFESTDLVCSSGTSSLLTCSPVAAALTAVRAGADVFVFYRQHNITFSKDGRPIGHLDAPTVPLRVLPAN